MGRRTPAFQGGECVRDSNRLNVAVSRARKKLIVVGNRKSLGSHVKNHVFQKFLKAVDKSIVVIPAPDITDEEIFLPCNAETMPETSEKQVSVLNSRSLVDIFDFK